MNEYCYIYPFILPEVELENHETTLLNCMDYALIYDYKFVKDCRAVTLHTVTIEMC